MPSDDPPAADRYSRQVRFAPIGRDGQRRLGQSSALVVGIGALGSHIAETLVRAGVGRVVVVDRDVVERSNLQRQTLFTEGDAREGRPKASAAAERLVEVNRDVVVEAITEDFSVDTFDRLDHRPDLILDGTDNFPTRMRINDLAIRDGIPWIYGAAIGSTGRAMAIVAGTTPCLRCLMPEAPPTGEIGTCETDGILASTIAHVAAFQTTEALRMLSDPNARPTAGMFTCDVWSQEFAIRLADARPDSTCASCGTGELPALSVAGDGDSVRLCGRNAVQIRPAAGCTIELDRLRGRLGEWATEVEQTTHFLRFSAEHVRFTVFRGGRALLFGVDDPGQARVLYDRFVGA